MTAPLHHPAGDVLNVSAYLFVDLDSPPGQLDVLHQTLQGKAEALGLKGTILLATEGINLFLAGPADAVRGFLAMLRADPRLSSLQAKESWSARPPFKRLRVRVRPEIIRMNHPTIRPVQGRAPAVDAPTLQRWLNQGHDDEGRPVVTLDTRNAFEVDHGAFEGALDWRIAKFTEFPAAAQAHLSELQGKTVVSYCTGGIRCEKAAIYLRELGLNHVLQLEGGILKYFEQVGGAHYHGSCFVFDEREALDSGLSPAVATQAISESLASAEAEPPNQAQQTTE